MSNFNNNISTPEDKGIEKGKAVPVGTRKGNMVKTANGWKYQKKSSSDKEKAPKKTSQDPEKGKQKPSKKNSQYYKLNELVKTASGKSGKIESFGDGVGKDGTQQIIVKLLDGGKAATTVGKVERIKKSFQECIDILKSETGDIEKTNKDAKFEKVMHEFKEGTLKTSAGKKVTDRKQALAIAASEAGI